MKVLEYLNEMVDEGCSHDESLNRLTEQYSIKISTNDNYKNLFVLNYCQISSPPLEKITRECRSLVLSIDNEGRFVVVSRSFDRFYNYGEKDTYPDIYKCIAHEKIDGSLVGLFYFNGEWLYRTRSMIMPTLSINGYNKTWEELIKPLIFNSNFYSPNRDLVHYQTYILEVVSLENRVVTKYDQSEIFLLAVRDNDDGHYSDQAYVNWIANSCGWSLPKTYQFSTIDQCLDVVKNLPNLQEGYVLYMDGVPACKVKSPSYVAAHRLRGEGLNGKRVMELVILGETDEYLSIFPEDRKVIEPYIESWSRLQGNIEEAFDKYNCIACQKQFALNVCNFPFSSVLFQARHTNEKPLQVLHSMSNSYKIKLFKTIQGETL